MNGPLVNWPLRGLGSPWNKLCRQQRIAWHSKLCRQQTTEEPEDRLLRTTHDSPLRPLFLLRLRNKRPLSTIHHHDITVTPLAQTTKKSTPKQTRFSQEAHRFHPSTNQKAAFRAHR